jgi:hypothetical protein
MYPKLMMSRTTGKIVKMIKYGHGYIVRQGRVRSIIDEYSNKYSNDWNQENFKDYSGTDYAKLIKEAPDFPPMSSECHSCEEKRCNTCTTAKQS